MELSSGIICAVMFACSVQGRHGPFSWWRARRVIIMESADVPGLCKTWLAGFWLTSRVDQQEKKAIMQDSFQSTYRTSVEECRRRIMLTI